MSLPEEVFSQTTRFTPKQNKTEQADAIMREVVAALIEKGYEPESQLVGYFLSGDPTYITNHLGARSKIREMECDELLESIIHKYLLDL